MVTAQMFSQKIDTWERRYGDDLNEGGKQIIRMNDGNYLINCNIITADYEDMIWVIAVNENGDSLWTKKIGGGGPASFYINDMDCFLDGSFCIAEGVNYQLGQSGHVSMNTSTYEEIWSKAYTNLPSFGVGVNAITCTADSGCVLAGYYQESLESGSGFIEKLDKNGNSVAYHQLESTLHDSIFIPYNRIEALMSRPGMFEEEYVAVGNMQTPDKIYPYIKVFVDSLNLFMENIVSFENLNYLFEGFDVLSNKYVIFGDSKMFDLDRSLRYSTWNIELSPSIHSVKETSDDNFFVGTTTKTYKLNKDADIIWEKDFGSNSLALTDDGGCLAVGSKYNDVWICKFDQDGNYVNINNYVGTVDGYELFQNYPNPFNPETTIKYSLSDNVQVKLSILDVTGKEVAELVNQKQERGNHEVNFNAEMLTSGIYFYKLSIDNKVVGSKSMIFLK
jgi:hypothetical protein